MHRIQQHKQMDSRSGHNSRCLNPVCFWPFTKICHGALDVTAKPPTARVLSPGFSVQSVNEPGTVRVIDGSIIACTWVVPPVAITIPQRATKPIRATSKTFLIFNRFSFLTKSIPIHITDIAYQGRRILRFEPDIASPNIEFTGIRL